MILADKCPKCGGKMGHNTVGNCQYIWLACISCGYRDRDIPKDILRFHTSCFRKQDK